jgi:hypothetical protein
MPSSSRRRAAGIALALLAACACPSPAAAQQVQGFAVERFYPSAPGGGWFVMDTLDMHGGLGGAMALTTGYAMKPLEVSDGAQRLAVVSDEAFADFAFAVTYDRWRLYVDLDVPIVIKGQGGTVGAYTYKAPSVDPGTNPDTLTDPRLGLDVRLLGDPGSRFRLGAGAQLFVPNVHGGLVPPDPRLDYDTDGTFRAMGRLLFAGDVGAFTYAGQLGVHVRPLDDSPAPGSPRGSELLFGVAGGARLPVGRGGGTALVIGPEIYGETAFGSFLTTDATGLEALLTGRLEATADEGARLRVKLGTGGGIDPHFGAPEWRLVFGVELFDHGTRAPAPAQPTGR